MSRVGSDRVDSGSVQNLMGLVRLGQGVSKYRGSGLLESSVFPILRVGPGRVGSDHEAFKLHGSR